MTADSQSELYALLAELEKEERALSAVRRRMHDRIDVFVGTGAEGHAVADLEGAERELSDRRRELQQRIDALRAGAIT